MSVPILFIKDGELTFVKKLILNNVNLSFLNGDKIALIGKNGSGKSSLLKIIDQTMHLSSGELYINPKITIKYLPQETEIISNSMPLDWINENNEEEFDQKTLNIIVNQLKVANKPINTLSGGEKKRLALAKVLASNPSVLLLDEPTNHLDIESIEWLEKYLSNYQGTVISISHDKQFLSNFTNKIIWIYKHTLYASNKGFKYVSEWQEQLLEAEQKQYQKMQKQLSQETLWLQQGISARRKRNQLRLSNLNQLKAKVIETKSAIKENKFNILTDIDKKKAKLVIEANSINFCYPNQALLIENFNIKVIKGEKIGIMGTNGSGKSTLVKILLKQIKPTNGNIRHGENLRIAYFSQNRDEINLQKTILQNICPSESNYVNFNNKTIHIAGYIKNFLFDPKLLHEKAETLSGGQLSKLLLAKILLKKSNLLILDEPTNNLDMESCDVLIDFLQNYQGTAIIVSHDRDFLRTIASRFIIMKNSQIYDIRGQFPNYQNIGIIKEQKQIIKKSNINASCTKEKNNKKISYKDKYEFEVLPKKIYQLEQELKNLEESLKEKDLFLHNKEKFITITKEITNKQKELENNIEKLILLEAKLS